MKAEIIGSQPPESVEAAPALQCLAGSIPQQRVRELDAHALPPEDMESWFTPLSGIP